MQPLHPLFVHLPLALASILPLVAAGLLLAWHKGWLPRRAFVVAVLLQAMLVGGTIAARMTGEEDEERVEKVVNEAAIEAHSDAADLFLYGAGAALVLLALSGLRGRAGKGLALAGTLATVGVLVLGIRVGHLGGQLVYKEGAAAAWTSPTGPGPAQGKHDDDD